MPELQPGVWHWKAPHPDWKPGVPSEQILEAPRPLLELPVELVLS